MHSALDIRWSQAVSRTHLSIDDGDSTFARRPESHRGILCIVDARHSKGFQLRSQPIGYLPSNRDSLGSERDDHGLATAKMLERSGKLPTRMLSIEVCPGGKHECMVPFSQTVM